MEVSTLKTTLKESMNKAEESMVRDFTAIRTGKASSSLVEGIQVDYYGSPVKLNAVASISTPDAKNIVLQPWDKNALGPIEKAIIASSLGISPVNDGKVIRLPMPELSTERRIALSKQVKARGEEAKVVVRNLRRDANEVAKKGQKAGELSEDDLKKLLDDIQKLTDDFIKTIDHQIEAKEKDLMVI